MIETSIYHVDSLQMVSYNLGNNLETSLIRLGVTRNMKLRRWHVNSCPNKSFQRSPSPISFLLPAFSHSFTFFLTFYLSFFSSITNFLFVLSFTLSRGFPGGSEVKASASNAGNPDSIPGFDPWVGKIPWRRKWQPTLVFLPGETHGRRSLVGSVQGVSKSRTRLSDFTSLSHYFKSYHLNWPNFGLKTYFKILII